MQVFTLKHIFSLIDAPFGLKNIAIDSLTDITESIALEAACKLVSKMGASRNKQYSIELPFSDTVTGAIVGKFVFIEL